MDRLLISRKNNTSSSRRKHWLAMAVLIAGTWLACQLPAIASPDAVATAATPIQSATSPPGGDNPLPPDGAGANDPRVGGQEFSGRSLITDREQLLSFSILLFGFAVLVVEYLLLRSPKRDASEILQLLAINLIVTGTLFLISAGYSAQEIAPGLGLLGTVAGYVLGRRSAVNGKTPDAERGDAL